MTDKSKTPKSRTRWSKKDKTELLNILSKYPKKLEGMPEAAKFLERSELAVTWQYYDLVKKGSKYREVSRTLPAYTEKVLKQAITKRLEIEIKSISILNNRLIIEY